MIGNGFANRWFDQTIYYFHVPLFFIASGYLYQKRSHVRSVAEWKANAFKKAVILGIPYFTFGALTLLLKLAFSAYVNSPASGFFRPLLLGDVGSCWYLYALFFIFLLVPTLSSYREAWIPLSLSVVAKIFAVVFEENLSLLVISGPCKNAFWFVLGMMIAIRGADALRRRKTGVLLAVLFLTGSVATCAANVTSAWVSWGMGLLGCLATLFLAYAAAEQYDKCAPITRKCAEYLEPIFLMHTIFAASLRSLLLKCGVTSGAVHIILGVAISFIGPVIAAEVMQRIHLEFLYNPGVLFQRTPKR